MTVAQLKRIRWAVRGVLFLGIAVSVTANILHANDNPISQAIAAWPPLALLLTVELISRVPIHRAWLAGTRLVSTASIAGIAAWVSYWHMAGVASRYGETGASPYLIPLSVDGLVVVASICLVELGGSIAAQAEKVTQPDRAPVTHASYAPGVMSDALSTRIELPPRRRTRPAASSVLTSGDAARDARDDAATQAARYHLDGKSGSIRDAAGKFGASEATVRRRIQAMTQTPPDDAPRVNGHRVDAMA